MGVSADTGNGDFEVAVMGGVTFEARISELSSARQSLMDAYTDLGLGQSAKIAASAAADDKAKAAKALADAALEAERVITRARAEAAKSLAEGAKKYDDMKRSAFSEAEAKKTEADAILSGAREIEGRAAAALAKAQQLARDADEKAFEVEELRTGLANSAAAYEAERARLKELREKVTKSLNTLSEA